MMTRMMRTFMVLFHSAGNQGQKILAMNP